MQASLLCACSRPDKNPIPRRHDFGSAFAFWNTRCSMCNAMTYNRGCREQKLLFCPGCFRKHVPNCPSCSASSRAADSTRREREVLPKGVIMDWVSIKSGARIPNSAVLIGTHVDGAMVYVGRYNGEAGQCIVKECVFKGFVGQRYGKKRLADILVISSMARVKWEPIEIGQQIPANAVHTGGTWSDGFVYVGRFNEELGKIKSKDNHMAGFFGSDKKDHQEVAEVLLLEWKWADAKRPVNIVASRPPCLPVIIVPGFLSSALEVEESMTMPSWKGERIWTDESKFGFKPSVPMGMRLKTIYEKGLFDAVARGDWPVSPRTLDPSESNDQLKAAWLNHLTLSADGEEQNGVRLKAIKGLQGISGADFGLDVLIQALQERGYIEGVNLAAAGYDWRLSPRALHQYFEELKIQIESLDREGLGVALLGHSMGNKVILYFLNYCQELYGRDWVNKHVYSWIAVSAPFLGSPSGARASLLGFTMDLGLSVPTHDALVMARSFCSLPWLWPLGDAAKRAFYFRRQGVLELRHLKVVVPNCVFESVKNDVMLTVEVRWDEDYKEVLTTTPAGSFDGTTAIFDKVRLQFAGPVSLPADATIIFVVKERGFADDQTNNVFSRLAKGAVATLHMINEASQGRAGLGAPKATTAPIRLGGMIGIESNFVASTFPLSPTWRFGAQTKAASNDTSDDHVEFEVYWRDSDALRPKRSGSETSVEDIVIEHSMFQHSQRDDVLYDRVQFQQLLAMDECTQSQRIWQHNYVDDTLYDHLVTKDGCPPIERLVAVNGTNIETEVTYVLRIRSCLLTPTSNRQSWFSLDDEAELISPVIRKSDGTEISLEMRKGILYANGDGVVPIGSLEHCAEWEDSLELKIDRLDGAEHCAILGDKRFHRILHDALIPRKQVGLL